MIKEYCSVTQIENEWRKISEQGNINYCQSYLWTKYTEEFCAGNIFKKLYFGNVRYFCYFDGDNCTMILPTQLKGKTAHLLGWKTPNDYEGFLYHTEVWVGVLRDMLDYISTRYGIKTFDFGFNTPKQNNFIPLLTELPENEWIIEKEESFNVMLP